VQNRNAMQAMLAADCINQTSPLLGATLLYTNLPNSTVGRGEGSAKAVEQEAAARAATRAAFTCRTVMPSKHAYTHALFLCSNTNMHLYSHDLS